MAHKTGNEETEFKVAPPCLNSRAATQNTPPQPITPPPQMTPSPPFMTSSSSPMTSSPSPSHTSSRLLRSSSSSESPMMMTSSTPSLNKSPIESAPQLLTSSSPLLQSPKSAFLRSSPVLTSSSTSASPRSSPMVKLSNSEEEEANISMSMPMKRKANRCSGCSKKVGLTGIRCRCGQLFCSSHRYSDRHDCTFDYKSSGREAIARENPIIKAAKIVRI